MKKKLIIGVLLVAVIGTVAGIQYNLRNKQEVTTVKTSSVAMGDVNMFLATTGSIESKNVKEYSVSATTQIATINVKVGDNVKKGDVLLTYETADLNSQVKTAQLNYNNSISQKKDAVNKNNDANNTIDDTADIPANASTINSAKASLLSNERLKQLDNAMALAKTNLDSAKNKLAQNSSISSDLDGVVTAVSVVSGQTGSQGKAIVVQDITSLKAVVKVGKYDAAKVAVGQESTIKSNGKVYKAKVSNIYPTATVSTAATGGDTTLTVELDILEADALLKVNFDADVDILLNQALNVLKVPAETILTNKDGTTYLFVVQNGQALQKTVKLGVRSDADAQIVTGVKVDDIVILNPGTTVTNAVMVTVDAA
ncbi:MAG TPA: efflux RND transporter periplasmic adaptor subunit [Desulfosporosinus sp.]|nr:efflux RND transporter periplasmic adaptor subunit [Desulfosporosinus sp.]